MLSPQTKQTYQPLVAIVGRPNVGKSTLFNRLVGGREAVTASIPGTTRDRLSGTVQVDERSFTLVDTGGLSPPPQELLKDKIRMQVEMAIESADLLIFLLDGDTGLNPVDKEIALWLRKQKRPLITVVNKIDNIKRELSSAEFYHLGLGEPLLISAYHNVGIHDLLEKTMSLLPDCNLPIAESTIPKIAILGRTNVGKSMLMNSILGEERAIVDNIAGTTRDALDTEFVFRDQTLSIIDTAGIRRRGQIKQGIERYSVLRSIKAIQKCDVALMIMDATELSTAQDSHVFGLAVEAFKGVIAVVNKWDLVDDPDGLKREQAFSTVKQAFHFMPYVPVAFTSGLTGDGITELLNLVLEVYQERQLVTPHGQLQRVLKDAMAAQLPASTGTRKVSIGGIQQVDINPPTFVLAVNNARIHFSYRRYLENRIREAFDFKYTHLRIVFKTKRT